MSKHQKVRKTATYEGKRFEAEGATELEAMTKLAEKLAAAKRGENIVSPSMTVSAWYKKWKETYKDNKGLTAKSLRMYDEKFNAYIKPRIGNMRMSEVREMHLQQILNEQAGMSTSHVKKTRLVMQEMFRRARQSRLIQYDPAEMLDLPKTTERKRRAITEEERKAILEVCKTHRSGLWVMTLLYTGMRPGETAALTWGDIDFEADTINIHAAKESGTHDKIKAPKTKAGIRVLPHIPSAILPGLKAAKKGKRKKDPVFPTLQGGFQNENSLRRMWLGFKRELDIYCGAEMHRNKIVKSKLAPDLVPYCLRHTFATDCAKAGVPIDTVRWLMGHEDISVTANIYQDRDDSTLRNGMLMLEK